jgi:preprotein translocase subunit YajC
MEMNEIIVGLVLLCALVFIVFLVRKNQKDKKKYSNFLNKDYKKAAKKEADLDDDTY